MGYIRSLTRLLKSVVNYCVDISLTARDLGVEENEAVSENEKTVTYQ